MHSNPFTAMGHDLRELESKIERKADKHEISSLGGDVGRLEHSLREARSEIDGLRHQLETIQNQIANMQQSPDAPFKEE